MKPVRPSVAVVLAAALGAGLFLTGRASGNGGKAKMLVLEDRVTIEGGRTCFFRSEIDPTLFSLLALKDKYKVVRVQVRNEARQPLLLSRAKDTVELVFADRVVPGIITLDQRDAGLWDSFSVEMKRLLVYPGQVEPGEEESLFVFAPASGLDAPPQEIRLRLASLPRPVTLRHLVAAAKS
jgi:hypothetical protein